MLLMVRENLLVTFYVVAVGMEPDRAMVTFTEDVAVFKKAMFQMKRLPKVLEKRADALGHVPEQEAFQKLNDEKEQLRLRLKKIQEEGTLIVQTGMGIANANQPLTAATNARLFPNGRADVVAAAGFTVDPIDKKEPKMIDYRGRRESLSNIFMMLQNTSRQNAEHDRGPFIDTARRVV